MAPEQVNSPQFRRRTTPAGQACWQAQYTPKVMNRNAPLDFSVVPPVAIPGQAYTVPGSRKVDADGNDIAGVQTTLS